MKIGIWPSTITITKFRLYGDDLRKLFRLPKRKGGIKEVTYDGGILTVTYEKHNSKRMTLGG